MIPFYDATPTPKMQRELTKVARRHISRGKFIGGSAVEEFESNLARYLGGGYVVGVGNGLDALTLGLSALQVGPGDEVIVPAHTFMATWLAVHRLGAVVVAVDIDPSTGLCDVEQVLSKVTSKTKAFIPVHLYGNALDFRSQRESLRSLGVRVLEDCAQSIGAKLDDQLTGTIGDVGAFSFYPTKNLGALGDGGAIFTKDLEIADHIRSLRSYGFDGSNYEFKYLGINSRLDSLQAAFLNSKLHFLDAENATRRLQADLYLETFRKFGLKTFSTERSRSVFHHFPVLIDRRTEFRASMQREGVLTECHYPYTIEAFRSLAGNEACRVGEDDLIGAREVASKVTTFPIGSWMSRGAQRLVCDRIVRSLEKTN